MVTQRSNAIDVLKALAAVLIINSHLEDLHLRPWMSVDGLLGNSIFFFTTGFTLAGSLIRNDSQAFGSFLWKRLSRMYPGVWIVTLLMPGEPLYWSGTGAIHLLVYPTLFTFVTLILPAYPIFFLLVRSPQLRPHLGALAKLLVIIGCIVAWQQTSQMKAPGVPWGEVTKLAWMPHYFGVMCLGGFLAQRDTRAAPEKSVMGLAVLSLGIYAIYLALRLMGTPMLATKIGQGAHTAGLLAMPAVVLVVAIWWRFLDLPKVGATLRKGLIGSIIAFLAANTWETYMVHKGVAYWDFVHALPRPLGVLIVFVGTLVLAPVLGRITSLFFPTDKKPAQAGSSA